MSRGKFLVVVWQDGKTGRPMKSIFEFAPDGEKVVVATQIMSIKDALAYVEAFGGTILSHRITDKPNYSQTHF